MTSTLISHFYNEEYMLPWWLRHHTSLFDHGILIDNGSTDRSVEICRELAPTWDVIPSRNLHFSAASCDLEVMCLERQVSGWKMALNTTEFFCCRDMTLFLWALENSDRAGAFVRGVIMADRPETADVPPDPEFSLVGQRHDGYFEDEFLVAEGAFRKRSRLIHRRRYGAYSLGRHHSCIRDVAFHPPGALVLWFGFSPWTAEMRDRKLHVQDRMSQADMAQGRGAQHFIDPIRLDEMWSAEATRATDLRERSAYAQVLLGPAAKVPSPVTVLRQSSAGAQRTLTVGRREIRAVARRASIAWWLHDRRAAIVARIKRVAGRHPPRR